MGKKEESLTINLPLSWLWEKVKEVDLNWLMTSQKRQKSLYKQLRWNNSKIRPKTGWYSQKMIWLDSLTQICKTRQCITKLQQSNTTSHPTWQGQITTKNDQPEISLNPLIINLNNKKCSCQIQESEIRTISRSVRVTKPCSAMSKRCYGKQTTRESEKAQAFNLLSKKVK